MQSSISNTRRGKTTTWAQTAAMVDWLEAEGGRNFKFITGQLASEAPGVVAGRKLTKQAAYGDLVDYVKEKCGTNWNGTKAEPNISHFGGPNPLTKRKSLDDNGCCNPPGNVNLSLELLAKMYPPFPNVTIRHPCPSAS